MRFAAHDLDTALCFGGTVLATTPMLVAATREQAEPFFRALARGEMAGFALSEWAHGSDLAGNDARASKDGDGFVLEGTKAPTNNGTRGAFVVVLARTSDDDSPFSQTLFLVARGAPGLGEHPRFPSLGYRSMDLSGVVMRGVRVPASAVLGRVGEGFVHARRALEISRSGVATMGAGVTAACFAHASAHATSRVLYGAPIAALPAVRLRHERADEALLGERAELRLGERRRRLELARARFGQRALEPRRERAEPRALPGARGIDRVLDQLADAQGRHRHARSVAPQRAADAPAFGRLWCPRRTSIRGWRATNAWRRAKLSALRGPSAE
jgi:alkylation response protein AidB-like acyl-CoA dehydrogenase